MKHTNIFALLGGLSLFACMLIALLMMGDALKDSSQFSHFYSSLLIFNTLGLCLLAILILLNLKQLIRDWRAQVPGTKMTLRMIAMFTALSVTPVLVVYFFSLDFLHKGIDSWFDLRVEQALDDSLKLSRLALDTRMIELLKSTKQIAAEISTVSNIDIPIEIDKLRNRSNSIEITLFDKKSNIIASSSADTTRIILDRPSDTVLLQLQQGGSYTALNNAVNTGLHIRVVVNTTDSNQDNNKGILQALYPVSEQINTLTNRIQTSYIKYTELSYLREQLKLSLILILTLVLLFSILAAIWTAFYFSKRHVEPIRNMAEGTKAIADGDYHMQIPVTSNDELGFLVFSFNKMSKKIAQARDEAKRSQQAVEAQQDYLETVLGKLSSGVLVFDQDDVLHTSNVSAEQILGVPISSSINDSLENICHQYQHLEPIRQTIMTHSNTEKDWREQIRLFGSNGRQILICSRTPHSSTQNQNGGYIIVFDDVTKLIQGQKIAAWSEMAQRLAHEIKNPLTPIQLAAERLCQKYLKAMPKKDADIFSRLTTTIIKQVETMKEMVNTFSDYAISSKANRQMMNANELINEVLDLFANVDKKIKITKELETNLPQISADTNRLRQVLNNLLKNAFDACKNIHNPVIKITSKRILIVDKKHIEISISNSGKSIEKEIMTDIFEPYVTNKKNGTGLGLAIVKKIVEEHNGIVWLENNRDNHGVSAIIRLPTTKTLSNSDEKTHKSRIVA